MPWEVRREDIEQHMRWMEQEGLARSTINEAIVPIANFYQWCE
jgi:site-specific recombinase XerD